MTVATTVRKAVFPVAGLGTRFLPATKASPKEMLPVVDKPLIQYAVEEAYAAGIRHMIFVTGRSKRAIEDHFDTAYELEAELEAAGKKELLELVRSIQPSDMDCAFVRQPRSMGLGHAVLCAEPLVGNEPFAVLLADDLMVGTPGGPGVLAQMTEAFAKQGRSLLAVQEVPPEALPTLAVPDLQRVNHRFRAVAGDEGDPGRAVASAAKDRGLRTRDPIHHRDPGRADPAFGPKRAGDLQRWPVREGGEEGKLGGQVRHRGGIGDDRVDDAPAAGVERGIQRRVTLADQGQRVSNRGFKRGKVGLGEGTVASGGGDALAASGPVAKGKGAKLPAARRRPGRFHHFGKQVGVKQVGGHPNIRVSLTIA